MKSFTPKDIILLLVIFFGLIIVLSILKSMNIYEGLEGDKSPESTTKVADTDESVKGSKPAKEGVKPTISSNG